MSAASRPMLSVISAKMPRPRTQAMLLGAGLPIGYLVAKHVSWESSRDGKKRMLIHQLTFWSALAAGLVTMHRIKRKRWSNPVKALACLLATAPGVFAFEGGSRLAKWLVPYPPQAELTKPVRYVPPFLQAPTPLKR